MKKPNSPLDRGRAAVRGVVTRRSLLTRVNLKGVKPLPFHLQVLPQRMKRLPRHIGCDAHASGIPDAAANLYRDYTIHNFFNMDGLDREPKRWRVTLHGWEDGDVAYTDSFQWAWAWQTAATMKGLRVTVDEEKSNGEKDVPHVSNRGLEGDSETAETSGAEAVVAGQ